MSFFRPFLLGMFTAGLVLGSWWLVLICGLATLVTGRSYIVLCAGVALDIVFASVGAPFVFFGFYTALFVVATFVFEYVRTRLLWTS